MQARLTAGLLAAALLVLLPATSASAAGAGKAHGDGGTSGPTGNDISWPQCGTSFPSGQAFGIVGVNDGLANTLNPCFGLYNGGTAGSELAWALGSSGAVAAQPTAQIYVNTADPGNWYNGKPIADWPASGTSTAYGDCTTTVVSGDTVGDNSDACAYVYGQQRAAQDVAWVTQAASDLTAPAASTYHWWLDVEIGNSWMSDTTMNVAVLQGMVDQLKTTASVAYVGVYSTSYQWGQITAGVATGSIAGLDDWIPGATRQSSAQSNCGLPSFTGGRVALTQWSRAGVDGDVSCF